MPYQVARRVINKETGSVGANHDGDGPSQGSSPNRVTTSMDLRVANNQGPGIQNNNQGGTQNNATGGVSIFGSTFNAEVRFVIDKDKFRDEILPKLRVWLLGNHIIDDRYDNSIRKRLHNTCNWILKCEEFIEWQSESPSSPKFLWIHGPPGFGKTVLCASVIEHIKNKQQGPVAYYFFSSGLENRKDPIVAMRSWIHHITLVNESVRDVVRHKWGQGVAASQAVIIQLFREAVKLAPKCTLVVDGLDECTPEESCLSVADFVKIVDEAVKGTGAKILVISRREDVIHEALSYIKHAQFFEYEVSEKDIRSYIDVLPKHIVQGRVSSQTKLTITLVARMVSDRCEGQFLWLRLQDMPLRVFETPLQPQNAVEATPVYLSKLSDLNWKIITKLSENKKSQATLLLRLATFSLRPLTVGEISEAILVCDEHEGITPYEVPNPGDNKSTKRKILDLCNSLLEIRMKGPEFLVGEWTVHSIHSIVKESLMENKSYESTAQTNNNLTITAEHGMLAPLCIRYMSFSQVWKEYGAEIGLRDSQGQTALYNAASNGHLGLVKLLIDKGADIIISHHDGVSPAHAACTRCTRYLSADFTLHSKL